MNVLDPFVKRSIFTVEEDSLIRDFASNFDVRTADMVNDAELVHDSILWHKLSQLLPGRTDNQIYRRWKQLIDESTSNTYLENKRLRKRYIPSSYGR